MKTSKLCEIVGISLPRFKSIKKRFNPSFLISESEETEADGDQSHADWDFKAAVSLKVMLDLSDYRGLDEARGLDAGDPEQKRMSGVQGACSAAVAENLMHDLFLNGVEMVRLVDPAGADIWGAWVTTNNQGSGGVRFNGGHFLTGDYPSLSLKIMALQSKNSRIVQVNISRAAKVVAFEGCVSFVPECVEIMKAVLADCEVAEHA